MSATMRAEMTEETQAQLDRIEQMLTKLLTLAAGPAPSFDPEVFTDAKEWTGEPQKGKKFSQVPPACLDIMAAMFTRFAAKSKTEGATLKNGKPKFEWDEKLADAATRWARYLRATTGSATEPVDDLGSL